MPSERVTHIIPAGEPVLTGRSEDGADIPLLVWRFPTPLYAVSSGPLGGGIGVRHWLINATVPMSYRRDDPDVHLADLADRLDLRGPGIGLLTGVDVTEVRMADDDAVRVWATVGLGTPIRAADAPTGTGQPVERVGTVNIVAVLPVRHGDAALVNAVATATEAKAQALWELGLDATGTPTDSVTVLCPSTGPVASYGGPRSRYGASLARAVRQVVYDGGGRQVVPWSDQQRPA